MVISIFLGGVSEMGVGGLVSRVGHPTLLTSDPSPTVGNTIIQPKNKICKV